MTQSVADQSWGLNFVNDPFAGSPTKTLLRLLRGPRHQLKSCFQRQPDISPTVLSPMISVNGAVPRSDGRCVQRAGT